MLLISHKDSAPTLLGIDIPAYDTHLLLLDVVEDRCLYVEFQYTAVIAALKPLVDKGNSVLLDSSDMLSIAPEFYVALENSFNVYKIKWAW